MILIVKFLFDLPRAGALIIVGMLAGCGQKGPLYLPAKPAPVASPAPKMPPVPASTQPDNIQAPASK